MIIFIKDKKSFLTKTAAVVLQYEIHQSIYNAVSTATIQTPETPPEEGDFLIFDGTDYVGIITEVSEDRGQTEISAEQAVRLFSRPMFYTASSYTYLEDNLQALIEANYSNCTDAEYKVPFLTATAGTHTAKNIKPDLENNIYDIAAYMAKLRRLQGIVCDWSYTRTALILSIYKKAFPTHNIDMSNPAYTVTEQTVSKNAVGKITVFCEATNAYSNWYILTDGTIQQTYTTQDRVDGDWICITVKEAADIQDAVTDEFMRNSYSHRITFRCAGAFGLYDQLKIRMQGKVFSSYVSGLIRRSDTPLIEVECGELQTQYPFLERI